MFLIIFSYEKYDPKQWGKTRTRNRQPEEKDKWEKNGYISEIVHVCACILELESR